MISKMEDYSEYIIAKREYEVFPDGGYTIIKTEPSEHHLVRLIAEEGGMVSTEYLCYLSGSAHRIPLFREKKLTPSIEMGYVMTIEENGKEYCILTEKGTELYKVISTQETAVSTQETQKSTQEILGKGIEDILEILGKRANKLGKRLGKNRIAIIKLVYKDPTVSSVEMAEYIGISPTAIDNNIKQMRDIFIRRIGPKKGGHWEIITE